MVGGGGGAQTAHIAANLFAGWYRLMNYLMLQVNKWIREIQKVTKLDRDPSSGTALQGPSDTVAPTPLPTPPICKKSSRSFGITDLDHLNAGPDTLPSQEYWCQIEKKRGRS